MIALIDVDGLFYKAVYKIKSYSELKELIETGLTREGIYEEIVDASIHRLENMVMQILEDVENSGIVVDDIYYYITECRNSFRKKISIDYKKNRKRNKYVGMLKSKFKETTDNVYGSDTYEADDLIAETIKILDEKDYIIISMDKDVLNLVGWKYDFYKGVNDEKMRGIGFTTKQEHYNFLAYQMLCGDSGDGIKGCKGVGVKGALKAIENKTGYSLAKAVIEKYYEKNHTKEDLKLNYRLLKLGV